jgi:hypothetical protein
LDYKEKILQLTADQRQQIYEEEKNRIKQESPTFSKKTKIIIEVYILGCLLLYFGFTNAVFGLWTDHIWELKPEPNIFESLLEAVVTLVRPVFAVIISCWFVFIPIGIVWGLWSGGTDIVSSFKRLINRDKI